MVTYTVRKANPLSKWPYRIIRANTPATGKTVTHKLGVKFETAEQARAYISTHAALIDRYA